MDGALEVGAVPNCLMSSTGVPMASNGGICRMLRVVEAVTPSSWYFCSRASSTARACGPYLVNTSRLRTFSARSRRVSGG